MSELDWISKMDWIDDKFTKFVCKLTRCTSCPAKPLREGCRERLMECLQQEHKESVDD